MATEPAPERGGRWHKPAVNGDKLRDQMTLRGVTVGRLSRMTATDDPAVPLISPGAIMRILNGTTYSHRGNTAERLAAALGVDVAALLDAPERRTPRNVIALLVKPLGDDFELRGDAVLAAWGTDEYAVVESEQAAVDGIGQPALDVARSLKRYQAWMDAETRRFRGEAP
jgi:transcriptional regulator with XRE-family HTH domain